MSEQISAICLLGFFSHLWKLSQACTNWTRGNMTGKKHSLRGKQDKMFVASYLACYFGSWQCLCHVTMCVTGPQRKVLDFELGNEAEVAPHLLTELATCLRESVLCEITGCLCVNSSSDYNVDSQGSIKHVTTFKNTTQFGVCLQLYKHLKRESSALSRSSPNKNPFPCLPLTATWTLFRISPRPAMWKRTRWTWGVRIVSPFWKPCRA